MTDVEKIYDIYYDTYKPPKWIKTVNLEKYKKTTIVYYDSEKDVKELVKYREPVNICMNRLYDMNKMKKYFGYSKSKYNTESSNIAIYTKTPAIIENEEYDINVINVIAPALDDKMQPDFIRLEKLYDISPNLARAEYKCMLKQCFYKIEKCFLDHNFKCVILHAFGMGVFSTLSNILDIDTKKIFTECFNEVLKKYNNKIILNFINFIDHKVKFNKDIKQLIRIYNVDDMLIVNAWDCFSFVGNGNSGDNSLDGAMGSISAMQILCWPKTNKYIKYKKI